VRVALCCILLALCAPARADEPLRLGLFAPGVPFAGPAERVEFATRLAEHLAAQLGRGVGIGRSFARAADFAAAVRRGELDVAVVEGASVAAAGVPYPVLAAVVRDGRTSTPWEVVARDDVPDLLALRGRRLAVPTVGAREEAFLYHVLLSSELAKGTFGAVLQMPDALSAVIAVSLGRADAAFVPAGLVLPPGVRAIATGPRLMWPALVALPALRGVALERAVQAALSFHDEGGVIARFARSSDEPYRALGRAFRGTLRRGVMAVTPPRLPVDTLLGGRRFRITRTDVASFAASQDPAPASAPILAPRSGRR
jgi:hypothetical protein